MIQVARTAKPAILGKKETAWLAAYKHALLAYQAAPDNSGKKRTKETAEKKYGHLQIKTALESMFCGKCAYCESQVLHIDFGDIEHFKPKSKFPDLCFDWDNLLLSCGKCNSKSYKSDKFPDSNEGGPFVHPVNENPDDFFEFEFDPDTGTANVIPKNSNLRGETTERELGLNRPELVQHRSKVVKLMVALAICAAKGDQAALKELSNACREKDEYAAFARALMRKYRL